MLARLGRFALLAVSALVFGLLVAPPVSADPPVQNYGEAFPLCGTGTDDDGLYCVESFRKNGVKVTPPQVYAGKGVYDDPYVTSAGNAAVLFGVQTTTIAADGERSSVREVDPNATWTFTVNTGAIVPRQMNGRVRDLRFQRGGDASTGYWFRLTFRPTPVAFADFDFEEPCLAGYWCGDDTTVASEVYKGYADGGVDDGTLFADVPELLPGFAGYYFATNAQDYAALRNPDVNALEVKLANPHLRTAGHVATGYYETFLTDAMLTRAFNVVKPSSMSKSSFIVRRLGSTSLVPYTVTRERGGVRVVLNRIGYSAPVYRIRPKPTRPGSPKAVGLNRPVRQRAKLTFQAATDGGSEITSYVARCRSRSGSWHYARSKTSPVTVSHLPRHRAVFCQLRAVNRLGAGSWSALRRR